MTTACPCCTQAISASPLDVIIDECGLTDMEAAILETVWRGKGMPVMACRIFDAIYADDPDGGPTPTRMYMQLNAAMRRMRVKLGGTGLSIASAGRSKGWRLRFVASDVFPTRKEKAFDHDQQSAD